MSLIPFYQCCGSGSFSFFSAGYGSGSVHETVPETDLGRVVKISQNHGKFPPKPTKKNIKRMFNGHKCLPHKTEQIIFLRNFFL